MAGQTDSLVHFFTALQHFRAAGIRHLVAFISHRLQARFDGLRFLALAAGTGQLVRCHILHQQDDADNRDQKGKKHNRDQLFRCLDR